jgi:hypothetical protein
MKKQFALAAVLLVGVASGAPLWVRAADEKPAQDDPKEEPKVEWKKPQPEQWATIPEANFKIGFAKDWKLSGKTIKQGSSPDNQVGISAYIALEHTPKEAVANLQEQISQWHDGLQLTDPQEERECNGLKVLMTGGTAKHKKDGTVIDVAVDIVQAPTEDHKIVVILMMGVHDAMEKNSVGILTAQESYQKAE